jgi:hypothetical protein
VSSKPDAGQTAVVLDFSVGCLTGVCLGFETAAFNHFDKCSELIEIETAHGYKRRLLFRSR